MTAVLCILVSLGLAALGIMYNRAKRKRPGVKAKGVPPPLPPRVNTGASLSPASRTRTRSDNPASSGLLPSRRSFAAAVPNTARRSTAAGCGPRGIKPAQFPCCPFDKQRNIPGERQVIFWDGGANCYRCSRGHRFKSNGKLL